MTPHPLFDLDMAKEINYLGIGKDIISCEVFGKTYTFTKRELNEIIALYNAVRNDFQGRTVCWRDETGEIKLI